MKTGGKYKKISLRIITKMATTAERNGLYFAHKFCLGTGYELREMWLVYSVYFMGLIIEKWEKGELSEDDLGHIKMRVDFGKIAEERQVFSQIIDRPRVVV